MYCICNGYRYETIGHHPSAKWEIKAPPLGKVRPKFWWLKSFLDLFVGHHCGCQDQRESHQGGWLFTISAVSHNKCGKCNLGKYGVVDFSAVGGGRQLQTTPRAGSDQPQ